MLKSFFGAARAAYGHTKRQRCRINNSGQERANRVMVQSSLLSVSIPDRRIGKTVDANPGDRGLPGFYPAVHSGGCLRSGGSSRTRRSI